MRQAPRFVIARRPQADVAILGRHCPSEQAIVKTATAPDLSLRGGAADVAISGRHFQFVQGTDKNVPTNCVCSGAQDVYKRQTYHCVGDAIFLLDNLKPVPQIHYDLTPTARFANIVEWWESVREIKRRCPDIKMVLPAHEPTLIERFKETPVLGL